MLGCVAACKPKAEQRAPEAAVSVATVVPSASVAPPAASVHAPTSLPEADVKVFVARWEAAQNEHDFATYSKLYAERVMGVKRVGTYSKRFDRARWLVDRKPMVEGSAKVRVSDLQLVATSGGTRALFTQEFTSAGFHDIGRKELFLVPVTGGFAISREEMLSSEATTTGVAGETVLAYHRDGVVVARGFDGRSLKSQPKLLSAPNKEPFDIGFAVSADALSASAREWLGREVTVYSAKGEVCAGRVARFEVRVSAVPHFGMVKAWNGELDEPKATPSQIAASIAGTAQNEERFVVGVLDRSCAGAWATVSPHAFIKAATAGGALRDAGLRAFRALPKYGELERAFVKEGGDAKTNWEQDGELRVIELRPPARPALLMVSARVGAGCADFSGSLSMVWQVAGSADAPTLSPVGQSSPEHVLVHGAIDEGGATGLALLAGPDSYDQALSVVRIGQAKTSRGVLLTTAFWDCGC